MKTVTILIFEYSNPSNLSIEALEVYYRITSSIVKYLEQHSVVKKAIGKLFLRVLKEVGSSPFALNQAKIDSKFISHSDIHIVLFENLS